MAVQGSLKTITIPELFSLFHQLRKTGVLTLATESDERSFLFYKGNLVFASARDGTHRIGTYLVRMEILTQRELNECLARICASDIYLGQKLLESGKLQQKDINAAVQAQILDLLGEALTWEAGAFQFDDEEIPFTIPEGTPVSTHSTILEAARRADERSHTKTTFPDLDRLALRATSKSPDDLTESAQNTLELVDGNRSIEDIILASTTGERSTIDALQLLVNKGLVSIAEPESRIALQKEIREMRGAPVAPNVPGKLFAIFNSECQRIPKIVDVLHGDPILTAKALRAVAHKGKEIARSELSIRHLATTLGGFELRSLLLPEALRGLFFARAATFWKLGWEHAIFCAGTCRSLSQLLDYPYPEEAYLAGLLHNLGTFFLHHQDPTRYERIVAQSNAEKTDIESLEEQEFGVTHSLLGGTQAESWKFPRVLALTIQGHNKIEVKSANPLLNILSISCGLAEECGLQVGFIPTLDHQYKASLKKLGVSPKQLLSLVSKTPRAVVPTMA